MQENVSNVGNRYSKSLSFSRRMQFRWRIQPFSEFTDADVFDGYIEFESAADLIMRTMDGKLLRREIEVEIRRLLQELKQ